MLDGWLFSCPNTIQQLQFWSFSHHTHTYTHNRLHTLTYTSPIEQFINICYSFYWNKIIILDVKETVFRLNISHGGGCWLTYCVDCFKWQFREKNFTGSDELSRGTFPVICLKVLTYLLPIFIKTIHLIEVKQVSFDVNRF